MDFLFAALPLSILTHASGTAPYGTTLDYIVLDLISSRWIALDRAGSRLGRAFLYLSIYLYLSRPGTVV